MSNEVHEFDRVRVLTDHAQHLNAICSPSLHPKVFYEFMSGALVWSDETNDQTPVRLIWALRCIYAYRTSLMLNEPREELKPVWDVALTLFPNWVGFRPERRQPTPNLLDIYRRADISLRKCLRNLEREMNQKAAKPDITNDDVDN